MKYWFKNVADNIYIYPKSAPRNLILQTRTSDCNSALSSSQKYIPYTRQEIIAQDIILFLLYLVLSIVIDIINEKKQG